MIKMIEKLFKNEEGQGLVEYALIIALIAIALIAALGFLKNGVGNVFNNASTELANTGS
jgi:pilus assembly protein Flp/PilA